jgi:hypothetical protein
MCLSKYEYQVRLSDISAVCRTYLLNKKGLSKMSTIDSLFSTHSFLIRQNSSVEQSYIIITVVKNSQITYYSLRRRSLYKKMCCLSNWFQCCICIVLFFQFFSLVSFFLWLLCYIEFFFIVGRLEEWLNTDAKRIYVSKCCREQWKYNMATVSDKFTIMMFVTEEGGLIQCQVYRPFVPVYC